MTSVSRRPVVRGGDCRAQLAELFAYLDGELAPARCRVIERHLANCACCGRLAERLRRSIAACRAAGRARLPARARTRACARIQQLLRSERAVLQRRTRRRSE
jgi:anti-sigma factor RsiW